MISIPKDDPAAPDAFPAAPGAPSALETPASPSEVPKETSASLQMPEGLEFYAPNYICLTVFAVIFFPPLGLAAVYFSSKTTEANQNQDWEQAYINSGWTGWLDVFAILIGLAIIYVYTLYM
ncbi:transmembrane protein PMIS2 [Dipodomys merriami]|uniref:transmembrane protein PMIS2 n=1 Tax=Dipodomys merriami TaxID=94247 RepID=UPI003855C363